MGVGEREGLGVFVFAIASDGFPVGFHVGYECVGFNDEQAQAVERVVERVALNIGEAIKSMVLGVVGFSDEADRCAGFDFHWFCLVGGEIICSRG